MELKARMDFLGGHPAKYKLPPTMCPVCLCLWVLLRQAFSLAVHLGN